MTYDELIESLRRATVGSEDLDREIAVCLDIPIEPWTRELSTAVKLTPTGCEWSVDGGYGGGTATVIHNDEAVTLEFAPTPELAMVIAALDARRLMDGKTYTAVDFETEFGEQEKGT